jgi:hypothetical protein
VRPTSSAISESRAFASDSGIVLEHIPPSEVGRGKGEYLSCSDVRFGRCQQVLERAYPGFHDGIVVNPAVRGAQQVRK